MQAEENQSICGWLQVAEALPVQSQADVMQRELESCYSLEYTPESLPLLLHQVRTKDSLQNNDNEEDNMKCN